MGDDLIVFSDATTGFQKKLNGLMKFCSNNKIIVNDFKTKSICSGTDENLNVSFNGKPIEQVNRYKYLDVIVRSINKIYAPIITQLFPISLAELYSAC